MAIEDARTYFNTIAARGREPKLEHVLGTWEIDIEGAGTWAIHVDDGVLMIFEGKPSAPNARVHVAEEDLKRLSRGDEHENVITSALRGALRIEGDITFAQKLEAVLPLREDEIPKAWRH